MSGVSSFTAASITQFGRRNRPAIRCTLDPAKKFTQTSICDSIDRITEPRKILSRNLSHNETTRNFLGESIFAKLYTICMKLAKIKIKLDRSKVVPRIVKSFSKRVASNVPKFGL